MTLSHHHLTRLKGAIAGSLLGLVVVLGLHMPFSTITVPLLSLFLALTACVYLGALLAQNQPLRVGALEIAVSVIVFGCALLGTLDAPFWLAIGYMIHGLWDWAHDTGMVTTKVSTWFPPLCALFDFVIAGFIFLFVR